MQPIWTCSNFHPPIIWQPLHFWKPTQGSHYSPSSIRTKRVLPFGMRTLRGSIIYYIFNFWRSFTPPLRYHLITNHFTITCSVIISEAPLSNNVNDPLRDPKNVCMETYFLNAKV